MAASGYTPISLYYSTTASAVPTAGNLANGELALNIADMKLYAKNSAGTVTLLASNASTTGVDSLSFGSTGLTPSTATTGAITVAGTLATTNGGTGRTSYTANSVLYASSTSAIASGSALTFDGTNLGIGNSSPTVKLVVGPATGAQNTARIYGDNNTSNAPVLSLYRTAARESVIAQTSSGMVFANTGGLANYLDATIDAAANLTINNSGNVGIGTSSPAYKLDVSGSAPFRVNTTANNQMILSVSGTAYSQIAANSSSALVVTDGGATGTLLNLTQAGNLGLGVTPSASWDTARKAFQISTTGSLVSSSLNTLLSDNWYVDGTGTSKYLTTGALSIYQQTSGAHKWFYATSGTAGTTATLTQAMTLDASGNLLVGTTSSGYRFAATKNGAASIVASLSDTQSTVRAECGTVAVDLNTTGSTGEVRTATNHPLVFGTNATERARITSAGAWSFGSSGTNTGTSGQVLTSAGSGAAPTWSTPSGITTGKSIAMAMIFGF